MRVDLPSSMADLEIPGPGWMVLRDDAPNS